jgi:hypothetical protein
MLMLVFAAAMALDAAAIAYFLTHGRSVGQLPVNAAIAVGALTLVGTGVAWISRSTSDALATMVSQVNAGIAVLAHNTGLEVFPAPPSTRGFSEVRGLYRGQRVVVAVEPRNTDELVTTITFPTATTTIADAARARADLYDGIAAEGARVTLSLERHMGWLERIRDPLTYDKQPESDPTRLQAALEAATAREAR